MTTLTDAPEANVEPSQPSRPRRILRTVLPILVVAAGVTGGWFWGRDTAPVTVLPPTTAALAVVTALPAGATLGTGDLQPVIIQHQPGQSQSLTGLVPAQSKGSVLGLVTRSPLPAGTLINRSDLIRAGALPGPTQGLVGLALKPGQIPQGGLAVGDQVELVGVPTNQQGPPQPVVLAGSSPVWAITGPDQSGSTSVVVLVTSAAATTLAAYAAIGAVAAVRLGM